MILILVTYRYCYHDHDVYGSMMTDAVCSQMSDAESQKVISDSDQNKNKKEALFRVTHWPLQRFYFDAKMQFAPLLALDRYQGAGFGALSVTSCANGFPAFFDFLLFGIHTFT